MATEQAVSRAQQDRQRLDQALAQLSAQAGLAAERDRLAVQVQHYALLKQKYVQKSAALKEVRLASFGGSSGLLECCNVLEHQVSVVRHSVAPSFY